MFQTQIFKPKDYKKLHPGDVIRIPQNNHLYRYRGVAKRFPYIQDTQTLLVVEDCLLITPEGLGGDYKYIPVSKLKGEVPINELTKKKYEVLEARVKDIEVIGNISDSFWLLLRDYTLGKAREMRFKADNLRQKEMTVYALLESYFRRQQDKN